MSEKALSQYERRFDSSCPAWENNKEYNIIYLRLQEGYFNDLLHHRGYLFLRDVYEGLCMPISKESCLAGWICNKDEYNFVEFYIQETDGPDIILDFNNVDENIIDKL